MARVTLVAKCAYLHHLSHTKTNSRGLGLNICPCKLLSAAITGRIILSLVNYSRYFVCLPIKRKKERGVGGGGIHND